MRTYLLVLILGSCASAQPASLGASASASQEPVLDAKGAEERRRAVAEVEELWQAQPRLRRHYEWQSSWTAQDCSALCERAKGFRPAEARICSLESEHRDVWFALQCERAQGYEGELQRRCSTCEPPRGPARFQVAPDPWLVQSDEPSGLAGRE